ncbi:MAG: trigger factor [Actinobacteria bacterium]|nr:trigger factor [Actinomycetota bacterium]
MADIKTTVNELEGDQVELTVEVPAEEVKAQVNKAIKKLSRDVKMPGFRPGKVPRPVLISHFGKEAIHAHALEDALSDWYTAAVEQSGVKPVDKPEIDFEQIEDEDKAYSFKAKVQVMPKVILGDYAGLEVEKEIAEVNEGEVDEEIERLQKRMAKLEPIEGRPAADGDFTLIDFTGFIDGEPLEGGAGKDYMLELGSGQFIPGFEEQIAGMETGQSKKLKLTFPDTYKPEELAGKEAEFEVTVKEIKQRLLPEADDEFASENSEFDTIAELRADIEARILKGRESAAESAFRARVLDRVMEDLELELPQPLIASRASQIEYEFIYSMEKQGASVKDYMEQTDEQKQLFMQHFYKQAEAVLKQEMVLEAIAEAEGLTVTDEDFMEEVTRAAESMGREVDELLEKTREQKHEQDIRDDLLRNKAAKALAEKSVPVMKTAAEMKEAAEAAAEAAAADIVAGEEAEAGDETKAEQKQEKQQEKAEEKVEEKEEAEA